MTVAEISQKLEQVWRDILQIEDDLDETASFYDLGGDSLKSVILYDRLNEIFATEPSVDAFFQNPTYQNLCALMTVTQARSE